MAKWSEAYRRTLEAYQSLSVIASLGCREELICDDSEQIATERHLRFGGQRLDAGSELGNLVLAIQIFFVIEVFSV